MTTEQAIKINASQPHQIEQILPLPLLLSTPVSLCNGFYFNYHRQLNYQVPEILSSQHIIGISPQSFYASFKVNQNWQRQYYGESDIGIFPAYQASPAAQFEQDNQFIVLSFEPDFLISAVDESINIDNIEIIQQVKAYDPLVKQIGLAIKRELETSISDSRLYVESAANMLAVHLLKHYSTRKVNLKKYSHGLQNYKLKRIRDYINDNLDKDLSLAQMSQIVQMSPHYFATLFKQSMGIAPHQYVTKCRVEKAKYLLSYKEFSIIQISNLVGFKSQSHFAKVFRKYVGVTPRKFRIS
ncbi:transcriptional regulator containing an amidase domain and an AraC-type DNA-binding HTH domain [Rivularia sp. PCC 7116]|uniref:helix-turn-helix transcriptional regulator n=1 Tax=Rivularia sp. PCC 7116 TaxID=373994 RepID=UPI00029ED875|nr:AraC family transcriptional regulator [Rivularia sp. PCC 7116]AFY54413.1 transcriptional regulator containing an amidase domain and an AraC-type DNA-binding HTH domain [Rivularia sp. PCC 7116]